MNLTCSNCDFNTNDDDAKFCLKCGTKLVDQGEDAGKSLIEVEIEANSFQPGVEDYQCSDCGASVQLDESTCSFCGATTQLSKKFNTNKNPSTKAQKSNMAKGIFIIALPIIAAFLFFFFDPLDPPSSEVSESGGYSEYSVKDFDSLITQGEQLMREEKYSEALAKFTEASSKGSAVDEDRLTVAAQKMSEAKLKYAPELLAEAKALYAEKLYIDAYSSLQSALEYDSNLTEAQTLLPEYEKQKTALEAKEREEAEKIAKQQAKQKMKEYEFGSGTVGIAVTEVKMTKTAGDYYFTDGNYYFVWLYVNASNAGTASTHINPNYFTLAVPGGYAANYDKATFSLSNYLDAKDIPPNTFTSGWLIFGVPKAESYELHFESLNSQVIKTIYP